MSHTRPTTAPGDFRDVGTVATIERSSQRRYLITRQEHPALGDFAAISYQCLKTHGWVTLGRVRVEMAMLREVADTLGYMADGGE